MSLVRQPWFALRHLAQLAWVGASLLLVGCQHLTPPARVPVADLDIEPVRLLFATEETATANAAEWERGVGSRNDDALQLSIDDAIAIALQSNPRLRSARAAIERARGQEQVAFAPFLPEIGLTNRIGAVSGNLSPGAPGPAGGIVGIGDSAHTFGQSELQVQWMIYDFGRTAGRAQRAGARERITELQYERAKETVGFDAAAGVLQGLLATALRVVQEEAIRAAEATLKDTKVRRAAGVVELDDVLRADVRLAEVRDAWVQAREAELAALARVNNVLGRNAAAPLTLRDPAVSAMPVPKLQECLETAAVQRPEVALVQEMVVAARSARQTAAADFKPRIYVRGSAGYVDGQHILTGFQEGFALHLDQPLYRGGAREGELRSADADLAEAAANAQTLLDNITLEVTLAFRTAGAAQARVELARPAVAQAEENLRLLRNRYRNGNATPTDLVDAESALTRARQRHLVASYDFLIARARLDYALGSRPAVSLGAAKENR